MWRPVRGRRLALALGLAWLSCGPASAWAQAMNEFVGALIKLCEERRGTQTNLSYAGERRVMLKYDLPLTEVVYGFYDRMKSISRGYASLDYEPKGYRAADLCRLDLLVNGDRVDSLSAIVHRETSYNKGRDLAVKMKELIPQQQYEVAVQAAIGSRVILTRASIFGRSEAGRRAERAFISLPRASNSASSSVMRGPAGGAIGSAFEARI